MAHTLPTACMPFAKTLPKSVAFKPVSQLRCTSRRSYRLQTRGRRIHRVVAAAQDEEDLPPWARNEKLRDLAAGDKPDLPFPVYLLGSAIVAIAATGSWFELKNGNAVFGVLKPDNPLWGIILGFFGVSGYPTAGFLFYRAIQSANKASERADKADGY